MIEDTDPIDDWSGEYQFLRNDFSCHIFVDGLQYPTVEHAFQAAKTDDISIKQQIADCPTAYDAKAIGRSVDLPHDWEERKINEMTNLIRQKFFIPPFSDDLGKTSDRLIRMVNNRDTFWGMVYDDDISSLVGENHLGKIIMQIRDEIKASKDALVLFQSVSKDEDEDDFSIIDPSVREREENRRVRQEASDRRQKQKQERQKAAQVDDGMISSDANQIATELLSLLGYSDSLEDTHENFSSVVDDISIGRKNSKEISSLIHKLGKKIHE